MAKKRKGNLPPVTKEEAKRIVDLLDKALVRFDGQVDEVEQAMGFYLFGRHVGWRTLVLMHNKRTIRKYEDILGIKIREEFRPVGPDAERSLAYRVAMTLSNFWRAVSGDEKLEVDRHALE
jgi:hypothetical protein